MALIDVWDPVAAETAVKEFVDLVLGDDAPGARAGRRNAPANMSGSVTITTLDGPRHDGSMPIRQQAPAQVRRTLSITAAAPGPWTVILSGGWTAAYVAQPTDTDAEIRDGLLASAVPGTIPVTVTPQAPAALSFVGDNPGEWYAFTVTPPAGGEVELTTEQDALVASETQPAVWRVRIQIHRQAPPGSTPRAGQLASRLRSALMFLEAAPPVVDPSDPRVDYGAPFRGRLVVHEVDGVISLATPAPGGAPVWDDIAAVAVDFGVIVGVKYSQPLLVSAELDSISVVER